MRRVSTIVAVISIIIATSVGLASCGPGAQQGTPTPTDTPTPTETPEPPKREPSVAISPLEGPPGTEVQISGAGFLAQTQVQIALARQAADAQLVLRARTGVDGIFGASLAIPGSAQPGQGWMVTVTGEQGAEATSATFRVSAPQYDPTVSISPASGRPGTMVELAAEGFPPEEGIEIGVGRENSEYDVVDTAATDADGSLRWGVVIPGHAEDGERWVVVVTTQDRSTETVSNIFEVVAGEYEPTVSISPASGPVGTELEVVARGFPPSTQVKVGLGRVDSEYDVIATAETDVEGSLSTRVVIPSFAKPEDAWVIVVMAQPSPVRAVSEEFDVLAAVTPTPGGTLFTRTNIYLIAVGDSGRSGKEIGCNDSVVPVEVEIEPTIAPLTAALNTLLRIDSRTYEETGLYNAFYLSDLEVDTVRIDDGRATIGLRGALILKGVCDEPRVVAQLRETALQYSTVDEVAIFINATRLEELLSSNAAATPEDGNLFRRTNIFLIAIGDEGRSGEEIGCGDSVVPVEVAIEPTIAPLTAALNELVSLGTSEYGMVGYYNALYRSDLLLEDVTIEDEEATILLSGTLRLGGACDAPRVRAQLEQTALQYETVDRVSIFVNGTPLQELLAQD